MRLASTRQIFEHWEQRRGLRRAPERSDIDPRAIQEALPDTLILEIEPMLGHPFRIAGTRLCTLFGQELRGVPFLDLWANRKNMAELVLILANEGLGLVAGAVVTTISRERLDCELALFPLQHQGSMQSRLLGSLTPCTVPNWFGRDPAHAICLGHHRFVRTECASVTRTPGRPVRKPNFIVLDGGRKVDAGATQRHL